MIRIVILVIVLGLIAWLVTFLPIPEPFRTIVWVVLVLALIYEILSMAGYVPSAWKSNPPPP